MEATCGHLPMYLENFTEIYPGDSLTHLCRAWSYDHRQTLNTLQWHENIHANFLVSYGNSAAVLHSNGCMDYWGW